MKIQKEHKKATLMKYTKEQLAEICMTLEHNINVLNEAFDIQYNNCVQMFNDMNLLNATYKYAKNIINGSGEVAQ